MEFDSLLHDPRSRRAFFRASGVTFVGGSAMFLAACGKPESSSSGSSGGSGGPGTPGANKESGSDVDILNQALDLEHKAIYAYTAGAKILKGDALKAAKLFLKHEQAHAAALQAAIEAMKGKPHVASASYEIGAPKTQTDVLKLADMIENVAVQAYVGAIPQLASPELRATAASIATNEAEHIAVLRTALGMPPVPSPFVAGAAA